VANCLLGVIRWITVSTLKELLSFIDRNLGQDSDRSEDISMVRDFVLLSEDLLQDFPVLEALVDCLLSVSNNLLHEFSLGWICNALGALDMLWGLSNVTVIRLNSFISRQVGEKTISENRDVIE
jgi:hypothetical protein